MTDLAAWASALTQKLAALGDDDSLVLRADSFPDLPDRVSMQGLRVDKNVHSYDGFIADSVAFHLDKHAATALGLALLKCEFDGRGLAIDLSKADDAISRVDIENSSNETHISGLDLKQSVERITYWPGVAQLHPWLSAPPADPYDYPSFVFQEDYGLTYGDTGYQEATCVRLNATQRGSCRLASLLLDLGRTENTCNDLETEGGFRGVAALSAECRVWLPGSVGFMHP